MAVTRSFPLNAQIKRTLSQMNSTLTVIKAGPGALLGAWICNTATTTRYIKFYNAVSGTTGTGTPVITVAIPGNSSDDIAAFLGVGGLGIQFSIGICVGCSTVATDVDNTAPTAGDVIANYFYV